MAIGELFPDDAKRRTTVRDSATLQFLVTLRFPHHAYWPSFLVACTMQSIAGDHYFKSLNDALKTGQ